MLIHLENKEEKGTSISLIMGNTIINNLVQRLLKVNPISIVPTDAPFLKTNKERKMKDSVQDQLSLQIVLREAEEVREDGDLKREEGLMSKTLKTWEDRETLTGISIVLKKTTMKILKDNPWRITMI